MKSVATERNYKMNARENIPPFRLITSIKSHTQVEDNEEWECKKEKTFYSGAPSFTSSLSSSVHAFKYTLNIKMNLVWWDTSQPHLTPSHWGMKYTTWYNSLSSDHGCFPSMFFFVIYLNWYKIQCSNTFLFINFDGFCFMFYESSYFTHSLQRSMSRQFQNKITIINTSYATENSKLC